MLSHLRTNSVGKPDGTPLGCGPLAAKIMDNLVFKIKNYIFQQNLVQNGDKLGAAVSGGPDSVAMLYCLNKLKKELQFDLVLFHINHMLRGEESDRDEAFTKDLAKSLNIPFYSKRVDAAAYQKEKKCSLQVAAREVRYFHLNELAENYSVTKIATGHTANDQAETVLIRILKGSGLSGIAGIPPIRENKFIRPLLEVAREEIEQFLKQNQIKSIIDSSNLKNNYLRNRIKNRLIPSLKEEYNPSIIETICRSSQIFRAEDEFMSKIAEGEFSRLIIENSEKKLVLDAARFKPLHAALKRRILLQGIYQFHNSGKQVSLNIIENILQVIESNSSGKSLSVFNGLELKYQYNQIIFEFKKKILIDNKIELKKLTIPGKTKITEIGKEVVSTIMQKQDIPTDYSQKNRLTAFVDFDFLSSKELFIRSRQSGDHFSPLGVSGHKKLKDYFIDKKIPRDERNLIPLITDNNSIFWIIGHQISESVKVKEHTKKVLMLELS